VNETKVLSLWQFWASAVALGLKEYETRSFPVKYRGTLIIHAAKRDPWDFLTLGLTPLMGTAFKGVGIVRSDQFPLGMLLGTVDLIDCQPTRLLRAHVSDQELDFGNWEDGRFCWHFANVRKFLEPLPYKGRQGLFNYVGELPEYAA